MSSALRASATTSSSTSPSRAAAARRRVDAFGHDADHAAARADARLCLRAGEHAALAVGADDDDGLPGEQSRRTCAGAPATSSTASATPSSMSAGSRAHRPLSKRIALPRIQTRPVATSTRAIGFDVQRRQRQRDERRDAFARRAGRCGRASRSPISSTRPTNMPPLPVTGLCCLPRSRDDRADVLADALRRRSRMRRAICLNDAESMLSVSTRRESRSQAATGVLSIRQASCGMAPAGSSTRCAPSGWQRRSRYGAHDRTVTPPRSNGMSARWSCACAPFRASLEAREQFVEMLRRARDDFADERLLAGDRMHFADLRHLARARG